MKIAIEWFQDQFNVALASQEGREPFITIKGCRMVNGKNGEFVSWPARKLDSGKYWNHVYASEAFSAMVLEEAKKTKPAADTRTHSERKQHQRDDDIPF